MVDIRFEVLDTTYHLCSDERQYILYRVVKSEAKDAVDGLKLVDTRYFLRLESVWNYIERITPIQTSKVLSSLKDVKQVNEAVRAAISILREEVGE